MKLLQSYLYGLIKKEVQRMEEENRAPFFANKRELLKIVNNDIDESMIELEKDGLIKISSNINGITLYKLIERK